MAGSKHLSIRLTARAQKKTHSEFLIATEHKEKQLRVEGTEERTEIAHKHEGNGSHCTNK